VSFILEFSLPEKTPHLDLALHHAHIPHPSEQKPGRPCHLAQHDAMTPQSVEMFSATTKAPLQSR